MISYFDTSTLIKKYVEEEGSQEVLSRWNQSDGIVISSVVFAEFFSAMNRKRREGNVSEEDYEIVAQDFKEDWESSFLKIEVNDRLNQLVKKLTERYPLRGFDAIHLASAIYHAQCLEEGLFFICADRRLNDAARAENLNVIDPS